jgi:DnaK suppressor protein
MGEKKIKKKKSKKPVKKAAVKPKAAPKRKTSLKKPSSKRTSKKTLSKNRRTAPLRGKITPKKTAAKKPLKKTKAATVKKKKKPVKVRTSRKTIIKSEAEKKVDLRKLLIKEREELVKEAKEEISKYIKGETRQLVDTALDDGDWSVVDLSEDISLKQLSTHRENLQRIDEALRKLNEDTYGICEDCGEEISGDRLKILPFAIYCIDCQERREQIEAMERKKGIH